jgi:hypothetical protein
MARQALPELRALAAQAASKVPVTLPDAFAGMLSNPGPTSNLLPSKAPSTPALPPNVTKVTKATDTVKVGTDASDNYDIPYSPHSMHPPDVAARKFLQDAQAAGVDIKYPNGFVTATTRNITNIRAKAADVAASVPGVSSASLAAQFEGAATAKAAITHRDWLMKTMPQAAPALSRVFSDAVIHSIWKH